MVAGRRSRRVALVPSSYHPHFGGVEEHTRRVAEVLRRRGDMVEVWTVDRGDGPRTCNVDGVQVRYLPTPLPARRAGNVARFAVAFPGALRSWIGAAVGFRPDVIHIHCFGPNGPYAMAVSKLFRAPLVLTGHGETFADAGDIFGRSALMRRALRRGLRISAAVTACSEVAAEDLRARFGATDDVVVVPNGVDVDAVQVSSAELSQMRDRVVLAAGRLVNVKGFDLLIHAFADVAGHPRLMLVGDGPERVALESLVRRLGIADRVDFRGRVGAKEVRWLMGAADVVVVPSRKEAFGIVVLEAWASGTPLIATSRGGPADIVTDNVDGLIVDPEDGPALSSAIQRVLDEPRLGERLSAAGRETVRAYTWEVVADGYERIYERVARP